MKKWLTAKRRAAVLVLVTALVAAGAASGRFDPLLGEPLVALARLLVGA